MLVHSFSKSNEWFDDYSQFLTLLGLNAEPDSLVFAKNINGIGLNFSWVNDRFMTSDKTNYRKLKRGAVFIRRDKKRRSK